MTKFFLITSLLISNLVFGSVWTEDYPAAVKQAQTEKKDLLVFFTGSDWCPYCKALTKDILSKEAFEQEAPKHFVLVVVDDPHDIEQSDELKAQNKQLRKKYGVRGFPTLVLASAQEVKYIENGYAPDSTPDEYVKWLVQAKGIRPIDGLFTGKKYEAALVAIEKFRKQEGVIPDLAQHVLILRAVIFDKQGKPKAQIIEALEDAIAADPESKRAEALRETVKDLKDQPDNR